MIRSQLLGWNLAMAFAVIFSVSAAKPITTAGRIMVFFATSASISGFSTKVRVGDSLAFFLIFWWATFSARESATAAAGMNASAGRGASTGARISRAGWT